MSRSPSAVWFVSFCAALALAGCSAGGGARSDSESAGDPVRIRYVNYLSNQSLELVNPAHTDRVALYSTTRKLEDAGTKVQTAEVIDETLRYFREHGFYDKAIAGPAPARGSADPYSQVLEVETRKQPVHLGFHRGLAAEDQRRFLECTKAFLDIYNNTSQLQSVDRPPDWGSSPKKPGPQDPQDQR